MKCIYCGSEMELDETGIDCGVEYHSWNCLNDGCVTTCWQEEIKDDEWEHYDMEDL